MHADLAFNFRRFETFGCLLVALVEERFYGPAPET